MTFLPVLALSPRMAASGGERGLEQSIQLPAPPPGAPGFPSDSPGLDVFSGFQNPPLGYGEVPFWWWTGDPLDKDRLLWQIRELKKKGVTGMQANYAHEDTPDGRPIPTNRKYSPTSGGTLGMDRRECRKQGMGIGLSGYTLDWPGKKTNLFGKLLYSDPAR